jgi:hypothetical protein
MAHVAREDHRDRFERAPTLAGVVGKGREFDERRVVKQSSCSRAFVNSNVGICDAWMVAVSAAKKKWWVRTSQLQMGKFKSLGSTAVVSLQHSRGTPARVTC